MLIMNKKFFYQLKTKQKFENETFWNIVWVDIVEAESKELVKKIIQDEHGGIIAEKTTKKNEDKLDYRLFLIELDSYWEKHWLNNMRCSVCKIEYNRIKMKQFNENGVGEDICSQACRDSLRTVKEFDSYYEGNGNHKPVIYKITHKESGKVYIGKTIQAFTFRWYQHFFQSSKSDTKFHDSIKNSNPTEWLFEVLEMIQDCKRTDDNLVLQREQYWINQYNSIETGFNTATACKEIKDAA